MPKYLREVHLSHLALVLAGLLVASCGSGAEERATPASTAAATETGVAPPVGPPKPSTRAGAVSIASATGPYAGYGSDAEPGAFPRVVRHAMGETRLEKAPVRVVTLDTGELDAAIELGVKPVGAVDYGADGLPEYFTPDEVAGIEVVGTIQEPNLEAVARLKPDVILSSKTRHEKLYAQLSQIAPTVFGLRPGVTWKQGFPLIADALGREDAAAATVERYEERVAEVSSRLPVPRPTVSVTRVMASNVRLYQRANFLGVLLSDVGFPRPAAQDVDDFATEVSQEEVSQADADVILVAVFDVNKNAFAPGLLESPVWKGLGGVRAGRVHKVDDQTWLGGIGYHAAFAILDQLPELVAAPPR